MEGISKQKTHDKMVKLKPTISNTALNINVENTPLKKQENVRINNKQDPIVYKSVSWLFMPCSLAYLCEDHVPNSRNKSIRILSSFQCFRVNAIFMVLNLSNDNW